MKDNEFFTSSMNGYNKKEVVAYLEKLSAEMDKRESDCKQAISEAQEETADLAKRVSELTTFNEFLVREKQSLNDELVALRAQFDECSSELERIRPDAQRITDEANERARITLNDAENRAQEIIRTAQEESAKLSQAQAQDIEEKLSAASAAVEDLLARAQNIASGLDVSKRHIDAADALFKKLI